METGNSSGEKSTRRFREIVSDVVGELRATEITRSFSSITMEELVDQHIHQLSETKSQGAPARLDRVKAVYDALVNNIEDMKSMDPELFDTRSGTDEVNTPAEFENE